jgi:prepilin-type N-terminal cleavage/methylation domain-containing protein
METNLRGDEAMRGKRGITLIEILISLLISSLLMAGAYRVFRFQSRVYQYNERALDLQHEVRSVGDIILRDIRFAGFDSVDPQSQISINNPITVQREFLRVDYELDNTTSIEIIYQRVGNQILRLETTQDVSGTIARTQDNVLDNVEDFALVPISHDGKIDQVNLSIVVSRDGVRRSFESGTSLRN